jgi:hypothetical protein
MVGGEELDLVANLDLSTVDGNGGDWVVWCWCADWRASGGWRWRWSGRGGEAGDCVGVFLRVCFLGFRGIFISSSGKAIGNRLLVLFSGGWRPVDGGFVNEAVLGDIIEFAVSAHAGEGVHQIDPWRN